MPIIGISNLNAQGYTMIGNQLVYHPIFMTPEDRL